MLTSGSSGREYRIPAVYPAYIAAASTVRKSPRPASGYAVTEVPPEVDTKEDASDDEDASEDDKASDDAASSDDDESADEAKAKKKKRKKRGKKGGRR